MYKQLWLETIDPRHWVDSKASPLYQRLLSALISEELMGANKDSQVDGFGAMHDLDVDSCDFQGSKKKNMVDRLLKPATEMKELQEKELDQLCYEKLIEMAYEKSKASRRHHTAGGKNSNNKTPKQAALAFVRRTLERCHQFEKTGKSCFSEPEIKDMLIGRLAAAEDTLMDMEYNQSTSTPMGSQPTSSLACVGKNSENYAYSSDVLPSENALLEQTTGKKDKAWSNRVKKRELMLDDVGNGTHLSSSIKGKRSDRDRDGKGQASARSGTNKIGRPSLFNDSAERKPKSKPKQKTTQISSSRVPEQPKSSLSNPNEANELDALEETEPILDFSQLQIPDGLGDFDPQQGDIGSWLNMDDEEDFDMLELEIPMDDLSGLNIKL